MNVEQPELWIQTRTDRQLVLLAQFYDLTSRQGILVRIEQGKRREAMDETRQVAVLV